jgi:desulfoferrodoxin (superoxide reductase-like protein)
LLSASDKTVSKWESGRGLPDISLLEPLCGALNVSVAELLSGECVTNRNRCGNMAKSCFYVCPVCGNVIHSMGEGAFSCCGVALPLLESEEDDDAHVIEVEPVENECFVTIHHPMEKTHYISFLAYVTGDRVQTVKIYPEQSAQARFPACGRGMLYAFCNRHGLFSRKQP